MLFRCYFGAGSRSSHVAAETAVYKAGSVHVFGEISTNAYVDINRTVQDTIAETSATQMLNMVFLQRRWECIRRLLSSRQTSPQGAVMRPLEIRGNVDQDPLDLIGAGDQGLMFGFCLQMKRLN